MFFAKKKTVTQQPGAFVRLMRGIWSRRILWAALTSVIIIVCGAVELIRRYVWPNYVLVRVDRVMWVCHDYRTFNRGYRTVSTSGNALPVRCPPQHQSTMGDETQTGTQEIGRVITADAHLRFRGRVYIRPIWDDYRRITPVRVVPGECVELSVNRSGRVTNDWVERSRPCR